MNKLALALITAVSVLCLTTLAFAGSLAPGASMSCNDAKAIKLTSAGSHAEDRANANFVIWKSSNFTTIPVTLGPNDNNDSLNGADGGRTGLPQRGGMGKHKITLTSQNNFSRGDSIGDISGLVKITNTGQNPVTVTCN